MTGSWLTLTAAADRIAAVVGRPVSMAEVLALGESRRLTVRFEHEHYSVLEDSVTAYLERIAEPAFTPWTAADDPEGFRDRSDYDDTPNDEGDELQ